MSRIRANTITNQNANGAPNFPDGITVTGVVTATTTNQNITGDLSVTGNIGVGGTLTYEDVTNIDSVGIVTARSGINVSIGSSIGIGTDKPSASLYVHESNIAQGFTAHTNTAICAESSTNANIEIATGHNNTGALFFSDTGATGKGKIEYLHGSGGDLMTFHANGSERLRIGSAGQIGLGGANYGSSGQVLTSQGASSAAAWSTPSAGLFSSYAIICDGNKSSGTHGGQPPNTSSYNKRDLNTEIADPDGIVSISNNEFTLQAGSYYIHAAAPGHRMNQHQARLTNATDGSVVQYGMSVHSSDGNSGNSIAHVYARVTIGSAKAFKIEHRCTNTDGEGFGLANNFGNNQIYTIVEIFKEN